MKIRNILIALTLVVFGAVAASAGINAADRVVFSGAGASADGDVRLIRLVDSSDNPYITWSQSVSGTVTEQFRVNSDGFELGDSMAIQFGADGAEGGIVSDGTHLIVGTAGNEAKIGGALLLSTWQSFSETDGTPDVAGYSYSLATQNMTITDFDGTGIAAGQIIYIEAQAYTDIDVASSGLKRVNGPALAGRRSDFLAVQRD